MEKTKVTVYLKGNRKFSCFARDPIEYANDAIAHGWCNIVDDVTEYYPAHQVVKVTFPTPKD